MNLFVAKLNFDTTEETLRALFEENGEVSSCKIIINRDTGRSKGFGFVEMPDDDSARSAIENLNMAEVDGRQIVVKEAEDRPKREGGGGYRGGGDRRGGGGGYRGGGNRY
ncbi:MAG TPA: RNA-binding protein [Bacteroidetes bacterium]|nr:RNA-binding protein [Bacteroidota bacterium]